MNYTILSISIPDDMRASLRLRAHRRMCSVSEYVRELVRRDEDRAQMQQMREEAELNELQQQRLRSEQQERRRQFSQVRSQVGSMRRVPGEPSMWQGTDDDD